MTQKNGSNKKSQTCNFYETIFYILSKGKQE